MDAKELRIDNLVLDSTGNTHRVEGVYPNRDYSKWSGIPLTEEWLVKLNVNEEKEQNVFRINYVNYHKGTNTFNYCISYFFDENGYVDNCFNEVKYVHQLQNLYFALTGEELTINE